jgi:tripartite-type tricarboxylate transporter receptor subunit TctC
MIAAFPAGGTTDVIGRILAERLKGALGQPFIIENMSGARGAI